MKRGAEEKTRVEEGGDRILRREGGENEPEGAESARDESTPHLRVHEWGLNPVFWVSLPYQKPSEQTALLKPET